MHINLGRWTEDELDRIIRDASALVGPGERVAFISEKFLGTAYQANTLIGGQSRPEEFVINLSAMDCFTFLEYVEALRLSRSFPEFPDQLRRVRYRSGIVSFAARNHFFTDWAVHRKPFVQDTAPHIGKVVSVSKTLNLKADATHFLPGLDHVARTVSYMPVAALDEKVMKALEAGDYAAVFSDSPGLDVSHAGIIIRKDRTLFFRHASSADNIRKVVDQDLLDYMSGKPGLVVLRPV